MKKSSAMIFNFASILCWSVSPLLIRLVKDYFSVSFQNLFRFTVSIFIIWIFSLLTIGRKRIIESVRAVDLLLPKLLLVALSNFIHQLFLIKGVYMLLPGIVTIVEESVIIFSVLLAFIFIPAERKLIMQPGFIIGLLLAIVGVFLTMFPEISGGEAGRLETSTTGIIFVLISALAWAFFSLLIRLWFPSTPAPVVSSLVFSLVIPFFLLSMLIDQSPAILMAPPLSAWLYLIISGIIGIGLAYSFYYQALKGLGVTMTSSLSLLIPLIAMLASFFVFGETLSPIQIIGTIGLLGGCFLIIRKL